MTRTQIATADFSCGGMQKGTNGDESDERLILLPRGPRDPMALLMPPGKEDARDCARKTVIDNTHKHTIIATLSVKKGSEFTGPDAQFPRGGALACARGHVYI